VEMDLLPATIQYREDAIDSFVYAICANVNVDSLEFKLTPTYVAYMAARHVAKSDWTGRRLTTLTSLVARTLFATIEVWVSQYCVSFCLYLHALRLVDLSDLCVMWRFPSKSY
jgi:hypothetical protein